MKKWLASLVTLFWWIDISKINSISRLRSVNLLLTHSCDAHTCVKYFLKLILISNRIQAHLYVNGIKESNTCRVEVLTNGQIILSFPSLHFTSKSKEIVLCFRIRFKVWLFHSLAQFDWRKFDLFCCEGHNISSVSSFVVGFKPNISLALFTVSQQWKHFRVQVGYDYMFICLKKYYNFNVLQGFCRRFEYYSKYITY